MNLLSFLSKSDLSVNSNNSNGYISKDVILWAKCATLPVICIDFSLSQDSYAHFSRIEYLSSYYCPA